MAGLDPKPGDALLISGEANPDFDGDGQIFLRVIRAEATQPGRLWLYGYEINSRGTASRKRQVHVRRDGLREAEIWMLRPVPRRGLR
ncbi:hypothetical protein [Micromonospora sp. NBC_01796]|uniref:hypothetical protein n=1 Tax=Micromonospora sp. NBC_01796 TaxID=2975987 RepID=UPI002DD96ADB|nr:hypothetical protein [Micromonospora sp. NBC_01796]WSA86704.1 hypothetical protein OIE47_03500 [Micromonospora sp. NBC_01796]